MGEIEAAAAGQQKFAADRRHAVVNGDVRAAAGENLGRHQAGGPAADDGDVDDAQTDVTRNSLSASLDHDLDLFAGLEAARCGRAR